MTDTEWQISHSFQLPFCQALSRQVIMQNILFKNELDSYANEHSCRWNIFIRVYELSRLETHFDTLARGK